MQEPIFCTSTHSGRGNFNPHRRIQVQDPLVLERFQHKGADYEVCLEANAGRYNVWCRFAGGNRCDGYNFSVEMLTELDARMVKGISLITDLQATAKDAVLNDLWENYKVAVATLIQKPAT